MGLVIRLLFLALLACCLTSGLISSPRTAHAENGIFGYGGGTAEPFIQSGSDVWGRINPHFAGFPTASIATDLVVLGRSAPSSNPILWDALDNPILDASDLGSASAAGARLNLTFFDHWQWDFMFDLLFMGEMVSRQTVDTSGGVNLYFYQGVALDPVDTAIFRSDLDTGEFNVRRRFSPNFALLGGVRYLELSEQLNFNEGGGLGGYTSQSDNRLFGGQIGAEGVVPMGNLGRLFAVGKYGIYNNRYEVAAQALSNGQPIKIRVHDDMSSNVGEFNAGWEVSTVPCMTLRFGYQALWLTDMALTTDQLNQFSIFDASGNIRRGHPVYHGGFGGAVFTF
jgi:hypothetical protein